MTKIFKDRIQTCRIINLFDFLLFRNKNNISYLNPFGLYCGYFIQMNFSGLGSLTNSKSMQFIATANVALSKLHGWVRLHLWFLKCRLTEGCSGSRNLESLTFKIINFQNWSLSQVFRYKNGLLSKIFLSLQVLLWRWLYRIQLWDRLGRMLEFSMYEWR